MTVDESPDDCSRLAARGLSIALMGSPLQAEGVTVHGEELLRIDNAYAAHSFGCAGPYRTHLAAGGDPPFVYLSNDDTEIEQRALDGTLVRIIRRTPEPPPVTEEAWNAEQVHRARNREMDGWPRRTGDDEPIPRREQYPAVESILVDTEGYLWVREWSASESGMPDRWSVFGPEGRWLGGLAFPPDPAAPDLDLCARAAPTAGWGRTTL